MVERREWGSYALFLVLEVEEITLEFYGDNSFSWQGQ